MFVQRCTAAKTSQLTFKAGQCDFIIEARFPSTHAPHLSPLFYNRGNYLSSFIPYLKSPPILPLLPFLNHSLSQAPFLCATPLNCRMLSFPQKNEVGSLKS